MTDRRTTAFVLGGGGMLGAAEVGMLRSLLERNIGPDLIVGSSVGALNGAIVASNPTVDGIEQMTRAWTGLSNRQVFGNSIVSQITTLARHGTYLHANDALRQLLEDGIGVDTQFADLAVRFECIASCIERAAPQWFNSGSVIDAVLASCAVPGLLPAVKIGDEHFLDGGLIRSVPIGRAVELGATRVFVLHVGRLEHPLEVPTRPWQVATVVFEIARRHHFEEEMAALSSDIDVHVLPTGSTASSVSLRYRSTSGLTRRIESAYDATSQYLDGLDT
jgi:NTE family protein